MPELHHFPDPDSPGHPLTECRVEVCGLMPTQLPMRFVPNMPDAGPPRTGKTGDPHLTWCGVTPFGPDDLREQFPAGGATPDEDRPGQWPPPVPHDFDGNPEGLCNRCGVHFLDADGLCSPGGRP